MNLPSLSIRQPVFILMIMLSLIVVGYIGYTRLSIDLFPNTSNPTVSVSTTYSGAGPTEVLEQITQPLEEALSTLNGVTNINSTSRENSSQINIQFDLDMNPKDAYNSVRERVGTAQRSLPSTVNPPTVSQFDTTSSPILTFAIADKTGQLKSFELSGLVDDEISPRFERLDGVADVTVSGGRRREIDVNLKLDELRLHRITPAQVSAAIRNENVSIPGGSITQDGKDLVVRLPAQFKNLDDIANVTLATSRGTALRLQDIATISDTTSAATSYSRVNGKDGITVSVRKQSGANTLTVAKDTKAEIARVQRDYPGLNLVVTNDQSAFIEKSVQDSLSDLILGGIFASLVVLFFFRDLRNTLVTVAGLPIIMIGTFAAMSGLGLSLNMMTLLALSLAVGLVIDDAIVVRENIFRHMEAGESPQEASARGTTEVSLSVLAMTLTIVSVFFPIAFTSGQIGRFYREFGIAVTAAVLISLFEAFTFAPMLSAHLFKQRKVKSGHSREASATNLGWLDLGYRRVLSWTLRHMVTTSAVGLAFLALVVVLAPRMEFSFLPRIENGNFQVGLVLPTGTTLAVTDAQARKVESMLMTVDGVVNVLTNVGGGSSPERANFNVQLKDFNALSGIEAEVRAKLAGIQGLSYNFQGGFGGGGVGVGNRAIQINLLSFGSFDELNDAAQSIGKALADIPGVADIAYSTEPGKPEVRIQVDRTRAARYGLTAQTMGTTISSLVNGDTASRFMGGGSAANIVVRLQPQDRTRLDDILGLTVAAPNGQPVPLASVATIVSSSGPSVITRQNRQTQISIGVNTIGRSQAQAVADIRARAARVNLPPGVTMRFTGQVQQTENSLNTLIGSLVLSVIFMYMVLASQFGSITQPIVLMLALPLAIIGAFGALLVTHTGADMTAVIGLILLMGLAVKNSILLIDFANRLRAQGKSREEALLIAGPVRLRPVLMTTLSIILGMLPVALGLGAGGSFRAPMAIAVIGGLITSTILTLLVVPVAYTILDAVQTRLKRQPVVQPEALPAPASE